jgi:hypothetical protein
MSKDEALRLALAAFGEIAWSNETQWQSDRAKVAITAIKAALEAKVEPVAWMDEYGRLLKYVDHICPTDTPLYTTPPQRKPLTDEHIQNIWHDQTGLNYFAHVAEFVRAIETAHGIKGEV